MDERKHLILLHGKIKTNEIHFCEYSTQAQQYKVTFTNGKTYYYGSFSVQWYRDPEVLNPALFQISRNGKQFYHIQAIFSFNCGAFWHIVFQNGTGRTYPQNELTVITSCLSENTACNCLEYLRSLSKINDLRSQDGELLLVKQYEKLTFVPDYSALAIYLSPERHPIREHPVDTVIFPFGGNSSQFKAVRTALSNQMSVVQGPPGTGKTQTILNIIANLLIQNRTVQIVSNNNSAIENVLEKLSASQYSLDFLAAFLGKKDNKISFIEKQTGIYPDISSWERDAETLQKLQKKTAAISQELSDCFQKQERLAIAKQEAASLDLEMRYFEEFCSGLNFEPPNKAPRQKIAAQKILQLLQEYEALLEARENVSFWHRVKVSVFYGLFEWNYTKKDAPMIITCLLWLFYQTRSRELKQEIEILDNDLAVANQADKMKQLTHLSMEYLRAVLFERYGKKRNRPCVTEEDLWQNPKHVLDEYPIILSTTFSSRSSLKGIIYDYLIMDEASQVDLATGALALSCAKNAVIVGDLKQLPNVIPDIMKKQCNAVFTSYRLPEGYSFSDNSFLKSVCSVIPDIPQTLLREHYRCHPKIIGFCNQKFYNNELIIMTEDHGEPDVLSAFLTPVGNHRRGHANQRQIDITRQEVLPRFSNVAAENIGIIAPYREQVNYLVSELVESGLEIDTVHKFQGREKDAIILTTVDDEITSFSDDPYLLNVAISRAKEKLALVVSGNEQSPDSNIQDLISYIQYNNFSVTNSEIYSVFDLLYQQYTEQRILFLSRHKKVSEYDSENLMYAALVDLLRRHPDAPLQVVAHQSVRLLIRNYEKLTDEERRYASHPNTHVDFLIYNRISKKPVLAIEVDGFHYHRIGSLQAERDKLKNSILEKYSIPLLRFSTNGSGEIEKVERSLFSGEAAR